MEQIEVNSSNPQANQPKVVVVVVVVAAAVMAGSFGEGRVSKYT